MARGRDRALLISECGLRRCLKRVGSHWPSNALMRDGALILSCWAIAALKVNFFVVVLLILARFDILLELVFGEPLELYN